MPRSRASTDRRSHPATVLRLAVGVACLGSFGGAAQAQARGQDSLTIVSSEVPNAVTPASSYVLAQAGGTEGSTFTVRMTVSRGGATVFDRSGVGNIGAFVRFDEPPVVGDEMRIYDPADAPTPVLTYVFRTTLERPCTGDRRVAGRIGDGVPGTTASGPGVTLGGPAAAEPEQGVVQVTGDTYAATFSRVVAVGDRLTADFFSTNAVGGIAETEEGKVDVTTSFSLGPEPCEPSMGPPPPPTAPTAPPVVPLVPVVPPTPGPAPVPTPTPGTVVLRSAKKLLVHGRRTTVTFGRGAFSVAAGAVPTVAIEVSKANRGLLGRLSSAAAVATLTATDAAGNRDVRTTKLTIRASAA